LRQRCRGPRFSGALGKTGTQEYGMSIGRNVSRHAYTHARCSPISIARERMTKRPALPMLVENIHAGLRRIRAQAETHREANEQCFRRQSVYMYDEGSDAELQTHPGRVQYGHSLETTQDNDAHLEPSRCSHAKLVLMSDKSSRCGQKEENNSQGCRLRRKAWCHISKHGEVRGLLWHRTG
jgi:hypothetical protein